MHDWMRRRLDPEARYGLRLTMFGVALVLVAIPFGLLLQQVLRSGRLTHLDLSLARTLHRHVHGRFAADVLQTVSFLGKPVFLTAVVGVASAIVLRNGARRLAVFLVVTSLGGGIVDSLVKLAVNRDRPDLPDPIAHAAGKSFPSGHAMSSLIVYGAVVLVLLPLAAPRARHAVVAGVAVMLVAIGISRLALGVHYLSDVLGGWALGAAWLTGSTAVFETWRVERGRRRTAPLDEGVEPEVAQSA
jgi:undecaprenyl-diphosphatase